MNIITTVREMQEQMKSIRNAGKTIGFVPTMGYLHEGHLHLVEEAKKQNDVVVMSIFVNPLQFGPNEDFDRYPRDIEGDEKKAETAGVDYLFVPTVSEMYPSEASLNIIVTKRVNVLCGRKRPGHFDGVATVLTKLFHIVSPDRAYFGLKDAQQVAVVKSIVDDLNFPLEIVPVGIVREEDGLAKSSRNVYLTPEERKEAPALYRSLKKAEALIEEGELHTETIIKFISNELQEHTNGKIDYVEIYSYPQLEPIATINGTCIIAIAVQFSKARLIDNIIIEK
ncbi:pantoate--beta-alanine ligase [Heyndrickxia ginsengihumi]|uniref:Pantothenate synthetase n=1 Tax=Heyndrickxia ginsengihumi TaxID=363870 RepID=A0A0A6VAH9_9BACI|nr:pantoate--beta-alanine ligase [Heyndrickxia ginsengihumi]KHD84513.1 pantoate--beta-alanine ligase [Heyndrickxia ginsengihumi]MCM3022944.1 pantoate--beta-alanine ligase [Heyndrickxia ginsengihumi]NEY20628.1 pantoate--beta-alanine ligase [Heyndrickxia ginsengihumi]